MLFLIVSVLVIIQSIYGVGLLIFGVPLLTVLGYDYFETIGTLLPSSILISTIQVVKIRENISAELWILPIASCGIFLGSLLLLTAVKFEFIAIIIGSMMFIAAFVRIHHPIRLLLSKILKKYKIIFHFSNGILHGFTNLGGVLLTIYSRAVYDSKYQVVQCTAMYYLIYAFSQIIVLNFSGLAHIFLSGITFVPLTLLIYLTIGQLSLKRIGEKTFNVLTIVFFIFSGIAISLNYFLKNTLNVAS